MQVVSRIIAERMVAEGNKSSSYYPGGLGEGHRSVTSQPYDHAEMTFAYNVQPKRVEEMRAAVFAAIDSLRRVGPTTREMQDSTIESRESGSRRVIFASTVLRGEYIRGWSLDDLVDEARQDFPPLTADAIRDLAHKLFVE
jgi:hypothetical protein